MKGTFGKNLGFGGKMVLISNLISNKTNVL